jgi:hypothetical protein
MESSTATLNFPLQHNFFQRNLKISAATLTSLPQPETVYRDLKFSTATWNSAARFSSSLPAPGISPQSEEVAQSSGLSAANADTQ